MDLLTLMFRSKYDQASLVVVAIGLAINAAIDIARHRRAR